MRLALISDTHCLHRDVEVPPADLLIHAGDWGFSQYRGDLEDFDDWLRGLPIRLARILSPGNHESYLAEDPSMRSKTPSAKVLISEGVSIHGLNLWASPVTPYLGEPFSISTAAARAAHYATIPNDTHVLITHTPPYGVLDAESGSGEHYGCKELAAAVKRVRPLLHVFGHVHTGYGIVTKEHTTFVNAALLGQHGFIENRPIVLDIPEI
jgi:hypothetical protein